MQMRSRAGSTTRHWWGLWIRERLTKINGATSIFHFLWDPAAIAGELGYEPADAGELETFCDRAIEANPKQVAEIQAGNDKLVNFLTGQVMKLSKGKANPKQVTEILRSKLL